LAVCLKRKQPPAISVPEKDPESNPGFGFGPGGVLPTPGHFFAARDPPKTAESGAMPNGFAWACESVRHSKTCPRRAVGHATQPTPAAPRRPDRCDAKVRTKSCASSKTAAHLRRKRRDFPRCALSKTVRTFEQKCAPSAGPQALHPVPLRRKVAQPPASAASS
jgi:hypothetical protein